MVERLRDALRNVMAKYPFVIDAFVVLPDHLHCLWVLPLDDADFSTRWRLIKSHVTRRIEDRPVWQNHYWEHLIRDDRDYRHHMDYIHYNPVKHGLVGRPADWPYSSFRRCVARGIYTENWGDSEPRIPPGIGGE